MNTRTLATLRDMASHHTDRCDRPCASHGLTSYRCRGRYDWIMIGANSHDDAMREALRSSSVASRDTLEVWNGAKYVPATEGNEP